MIQWENRDNEVPILSWCADADEGTKTQARNLAYHPAVRERVCLMPDAHIGYGMPIGGVIACEEAVIPNAVGVDIGCGMGAVKTSLREEELGLGNETSFSSCSHGAGRRLGRAQANRTLTLEECEAAMSGIVYDRFGWAKKHGAHGRMENSLASDGKRLHDLSEAPLAYKDIDSVIAAEADLVKPVVKLSPLAVVKG